MSILTRFIPKNPWLLGVYLFICHTFFLLILALITYDGVTSLNQRLYILPVLVLLSCGTSGCFYSKSFQRELTVLDAMKAANIAILILVISNLDFDSRSANFKTVFIGWLFFTFLFAVALKFGSKLYIKYRQEVMGFYKFSTIKKEKNNESF